MPREMLVKSVSGRRDGREEEVLYRATGWISVHDREREASPRRKVWGNRLTEDAPTEPPLDRFASTPAIDLLSHTPDDAKRPLRRGSRRCQWCGVCL